MSDPIPPSDPLGSDRAFRFKSGTVIRAGWLAHDLPFLTRSLRYLLRPQGEQLRTDFALEAGDIGVLAVVASNPGVSQNDLAASLVLKKSAVTRVVQRLERRGFLHRERSTSDRRSNHLTLTAMGAALTRNVQQATLGQHATWFDGIDPAERAVFFDVLNRLVARLAESRVDDDSDDDD